MEQVVSYVLSLRDDPRSRAVLRRAANPATATRAYGYLAPWWDGRAYRKDAVCAFAGLTAAVPNLHQNDEVPIGAMAARLVKSNPASKNGIERRLIVAQNAPLPQLVVLLRSLLQRAERAGLVLDFNNLYWTLVRAEHPNSVLRTRSRQHLLEDFYKELSTAQPAPDAEPHVHSSSQRVADPTRSP